MYYLLKCLGTCKYGISATVNNLLYRIVSARRDLKHVFFQIINIIFIYSRSLKCPLHIASYALRIGVSVMEF